MISGSFAMSLIFCKEPFYDDFDLYFSKKSDLKNAIKLLDTSLEFKKISKTKHALTYLHEKKKKKLQLILKLRKSLYHLATGHDFINCSVAYSSKNNNFWISKNAYSIWRNKELEIQKTPLQNKNIPDIYYFNTYAILLQRVNKYKQRYGLSLSKKGTQQLNSFKKEFQKRAENYPPDYWLKPIDYNGTVYSFALKLFT